MFLPVHMSAAIALKVAHSIIMASLYEPPQHPELRFDATSIFQFTNSVRQVSNLTFLNQQNCCIEYANPPATTIVFP